MSSLKPHLLYARYVFRHKWFVFREGRKLGIGVCQLTKHDWSKFTPAEWFPYAHSFYGERTAAVKVAFDLAWLMHQKRNPHHWQWWVLPEDSGGLKVLPMPDKFRREMIADWRGAGQAQGKPDTAKWYLENREKMQLHPDTRGWVETVLGVQG